MKKDDGEVTWAGVIFKAIVCVVSIACFLRVWPIVTSDEEVAPVAPEASRAALHETNTTLSITLRADGFTGFNVYEIATLVDRYHLRGTIELTNKPCAEEEEDEGGTGEDADENHYTIRTLDEVSRRGWLVE